MNLILLSGGSGRRLWPLSNDTRSKQFLRLLKNDRGEPESMVQRVYRQLRAVCPEATVTIATGAAQADCIRSQLGSAVDIVVEPERRDTFPAILLAVAHLALVRGRNPSESVAILPVDPCAEEGYFRTVRRMLEEVSRSAADLVLMGIAPTYPSTKYGYILPEDDADPARVRHFAEKPDEETAAAYLRAGALWNGGVFACRIGYLTALARKYLPFSGFEEVRDDYALLPKISFDYEVVEKAPSVAVLRYTGKWKDLGTWNTLTEEMAAPVTGNAIMEACSNTHVINELGIPVVALGLRDAVIAASPDGILVSDKRRSPGIKPIADRLAGRPMAEEHSWGSCRVVDTLHAQDGSTALTRRVVLESGAELPPQLHRAHDEVWTVTAGRGELMLGKRRIPLRRGVTVSVPHGRTYSLFASTELQLIQVQLGTQGPRADASAPASPDPAADAKAAPAHP